MKSMQKYSNGIYAMVDLDITYTIYKSTKTTQTENIIRDKVMLYVNTPLQRESACPTTGGISLSSL